MKLFILVILLVIASCSTPRTYVPVRIECRNSFNQQQLDSLKRIDARIDSFLNRENKKQ